MMRLYLAICKYLRALVQIRIYSKALIPLSIYFLLISCNSDEKQLIGKWKTLSIESERGNEIKDVDSDDYYQFNNDGTYMNSFQNSTYIGNWKLDKKSKKIELEYGLATFKGNYRLLQDSLFLELDKYILQRKDSVLGKILIKLEKN
ncbi:lipocalin-like domain-containing protein [Flagellimonas pelagia]|nr:glycoside hydrolase family 43 C-terminal domain-containing protein [Allomuricauda maritima]TXK01217.1 hypothetical protein FQ017_00355 [Allomuricauda maritima]